MAPVPADALRALLAEQPREDLEAFVADLWRARGFAVRQDDGTLLADGRELRVVADPSGADAPGDGWLVATTPPPDGAGEAVLGPADLHELLLYDVERDRAADLFEHHFDRPMDGDWSDLRSWPRRLGTGGGEPADGDLPGDEPERAGVITLARERATAARATARSLVGDRRVQTLVLALVVVGAAAGWALAAYRPVASTGEDAPFADSGRAPVDGSFRAETSIRTAVYGEPVRYERVQTFSPAPPFVVTSRSTLATGGDVRTTVSHRRGTLVHGRTTWTNASAYRDAVDTRLFDWRIVRTVDSTRTVYTFERDTRGRVGLFVGGFARGVLGPLPYERAGTTTYGGREVVRYVPTAGWSRWRVAPDRYVTHRVDRVDGEVLVTPDGALVYADVTARTTRGATWAAVLANDSAPLSVQYRVVPGADRPEAPPWVDGVDWDTSNRNVTG